MLKKSRLKLNAVKALNLTEYKYKQIPMKIGIIHAKHLNIPKDECKVLRMLIECKESGIWMPNSLEWCRPLIAEAMKSQEALGIRHQFCYLTVRSGIVDSVNDDVWHVDGFSTRVTHIPEQNYIWCDKYPTQYLDQQFAIPKDFNPREHNIHTYFQDRAKDENIVILEEETMYAMDPYNIHRRHPAIRGVWRTFVRISFTPIEIDDVNNTQNYMLPTDYKQDGVAFRKTLKRY